MNKQPEALRLADELAIQDQCDFYKVCEEAALELRWLHEENERLRDAVAAEREACAKICDETRYTGYVPAEDGGARQYYDAAAEDCAEQIRARGER